MRISFGSVNEDGSPNNLGSEDWTVSGNNGQYRVNFNTPHYKIPVIVATLIEDRDNILNLGQTTKDCFEIKTYAASDNSPPTPQTIRTLEPSDFTFIAISN